MAVYAANRSLDGNMESSVELESFENYRLVQHVALYTDTLKTINGQNAKRVAPKHIAIKGGGPVILKKHSPNTPEYRIAS